MYSRNREQKYLEIKKKKKGIYVFQHPVSCNNNS